jgi:hypothetical protein
MVLSSKSVALIIGAYAVFVAILSLVAPDRLNPPKVEFPNLRQQFPEYYAVISADDTSRDRCIVEQGNKLSGFRDDYVKMAVMACDAATNVANRAIEERRERYEAAQRRPR